MNIFQNRFSLFSGIILLGLLVLNCHFNGNPEKNIRNNKDYNVLWIILDTCRRDRLSCYGYKRLTTPNIDRLSRESIIFKQAIAQATITNISFASFFTGQYPSGIGFFNKAHALNDTSLTLPEILKIYGYKTAAFVTGPVTHPIYGFSQGFDFYHHSLATNSDISSAKMSFRDFMPEAFQWLTKYQNDKFFLILHSNDTHLPYDIPESYQHLYDPEYQGVIDYFITNKELFIKGMDFLEALEGETLYLDELLSLIGNEKLAFNQKQIKLTPADLNHINAHYDGAVTYADYWVGEILNKLKKLKLMDNTIIVLSADHGEELGEHRHFGHHGMYLYDEVIRVPLIIKLPSNLQSPIYNLKSKIDYQVQLIDIMPTILDLLNIPAPADVQGHSLLPLIFESSSLNLTPDTSNLNFKYAFSEGGLIRQSVRTAQWKLICKLDNTQIELYDLLNDSGETENLVVREPEIVRQLLEKLADWRQKNKILKKGAVSLITNQKNTETERIKKPDKSEPGEGLFESEEMIIE